MGWDTGEKVGLRCNFWDSYNYWEKMTGLYYTVLYRQGSGLEEIRDVHLRTHRHYKNSGKC